MTATWTGLRDAAPARAAGARDERHDIQGLRAIAVGAVLLYHLWPHRLTGGYVGVDIFFVISGFLITTHLLRKPPQGVRGLLTFWARRIRRLIPAASVVMLVTVVASAIWLPRTVVGQVARETVAAALYVENWVLARSATDYLAAEQLKSPVQHYWSLSVEEQFYILWPVLIGLAVWAAARWSRRWVPAVVVGVIVIASLSWSVRQTALEPAAAYFVSTTRFWELGLGALLAAVIVLRPLTLAGPVRAACAWVGLALMALAVLTFTGETAFPGAAALIPVGGAALVIFAASDGVRAGPGALLGWRPAQWLGDVSYSVYLWHWPLIVIIPFAIGRDLTWPDKILILAATLILGALSKRYVEDPLRWSQRLSRRLASTFAVLAVSVAAVCGASWAVSAHAATQVKADVAAAAVAAEQAAHCLGAGAARDTECDLTGEELAITPDEAAEDKPDVYADGCWNNPPFTSRNVCKYGSQDPQVRIALVGNSHAGHWLPALQEVLKDHKDWQLTTFLQSQCYTVDLPIVLASAKDTSNCQKTNEWVLDSISEANFDLVITSNRTKEPLSGVEESQKTAVARAAYARTLTRMSAGGSDVLVLRDTPAMSENVPDCISQHVDEWAKCSTSANIAIEDDPLAKAARAAKSSSIHVASINDLMCYEGSCLPVIGGVIAYFDHGHLSATFSRTLAPEIGKAVSRALG